MKIKKTLVTLILLSILAVSSFSVVSATDDPGPMRGMAYIDPIDIITETEGVTNLGNSN